MKRKLIIDGNAIYEIDEECVLRKKAEMKEEGRQQGAKAHGKLNIDKNKRRE